MMQSIRARNLAKIWSALGAFNLFYTLNTWLTDRGAEAAFETFLLHKHADVAPLFGILVAAPLLAATALAGMAYVKEVATPIRAQRVPTIWLEDEPTSSAPFGAYKVFLIILLIGIPSLGLVHFIRQVLEAQVFVNDTGQIIGVWAAVPFEHDGYSFAIPEGPTFFPFWEPLVLVLLSIAAWLTAAAYLWRLTRRPGWAPGLRPPR